MPLCVISTAEPSCPVWNKAISLSLSDVLPYCVTFKACPVLLLDISNIVLTITLFCLSTLTIFSLYIRLLNINEPSTISEPDISTLLSKDALVIIFNGTLSWMEPIL